MRLVVQIPCLDEEETLPAVLASIPTQIPGIDDIIVLIVDDGCTDRTVEVARAYGVTEFVHHVRNQGLGRSFHDGIVRALELGADIVVNTDGDNQYPQARIGDLVQPLVRGEADIVIGDRQVHLVQHFSPTKRLLQRVGSAVVNRAAGTALPDAASGFRAYSRESLMVLNTITRFSYCMETIIQAGNKQLKIASLPIVTNPKTRESRLFKSTPEHVLKSARAIIRSFLMYRPYLVFLWLTVLFSVLGADPLRPLRRAPGPRGGGRAPPVARARRPAPDCRRDEPHARRHLRPHPHQPDPDRRHLGAHQEGALREVRHRAVARPGVAARLRLAVVGLQQRLEPPLTTMESLITTPPR